MTEEPEKAIAKLLMTFVVPLVLLATLFAIITVVRGRSPWPTSPSTAA